MPYGDLKLNARLFEDGECRCHGRLDLVVSASGDLEIVTGREDCIRQRIIIWLAIKKGEIPRKPWVGCCIHNYMHSGITTSKLKDLEADIRQDLKAVFPEEPFIDVVVESNSRNTVEMYASIGGTNVTLKTNKQEMLELNRMMTRSMIDMGFANYMRYWSGS